MMGLGRFIKKGGKLVGGDGWEGKKKNLPPVPPPKPVRNNLKVDEETSFGSGETVAMMMKGGNLQTVKAYLVKGALVNFQLFQKVQESAEGPFGGGVIRNEQWKGLGEPITLQAADVKIVRGGGGHEVEVGGGGTSADEDDLNVGLIKVITEGGGDNALMITLRKVNGAFGRWDDQVNLKVEGDVLRRIGEIFGTENVEISVELEKPSCIASSRGSSLSSADSVDSQRDVVDSPSQEAPPKDRDQGQGRAQASPEASFSGGSGEAAELDFSDNLNASSSGETKDDDDAPNEDDADKSKEDQIDGLHGITRHLLRLTSGSGLGKVYKTNEPIYLLEEISRVNDLPLLVSDTDGLVYCQGTLDINRSWLKTWFVPPGFNGRYSKVAKISVIVSVTNTDPSAPEEELGGLDDAQGILEVNKKLLEEEIQTDLELFPGNGVLGVKCHSGFLVAQSEFFKGILNPKPERMIMDDMTAEGVRALLAFLYYRGTKEPMGRMDICVELLKAGYKYRIGSLEIAMKDIILENKRKQNEKWFGVEATLALFFFANGLERFWELKEKAVATLKMKAKEVVASEAYSRIFQEDPSAAKELASVFLIMSF